MPITVEERPVYINADGEDQKIVLNVSGATLSYGPYTNRVWTTEGTLAVGSAMTLSRGTWYMSASTSALLVEDVGDLRVRVLAIEQGGGSGAADASTTVKGISKVSVASVSPTSPVAVGDNDPRMTDARAPTAHTHPQAEITNLTTDLGNKQTLDADLTAIAGLSPSNDDVVQRKAGAWTNRTPAQVKTDLALTKTDVGLANVDNTADSAKPISTATQTALDTLTAADKVVTANTQTASYTLVLGDAGKAVEMNHATNALVLTVPPNSSVAFPTGTVIEIVRIGAGTVTITPGSGVTLPNTVEAAGTTSRTITTRYGSASLRKRATDEWVLVGGIS